jgi:hypothetical protein
LTVPVGIPDGEATVIVKESETFTFGALLAAVIVVVVVSKTGVVDEFAGQAATRFATSTLPNPLAWS